MKTKVLGLTACALLLGACSNSGGDAPAVNRAPTLAGPGDQTIGANKPTAPIGITVGDEDAGAVTLTATSDNAAVLGDDGITLSGAGSARSLVLTPVPDTLGQATVTLIATDAAGLSSTRRIAVTVTPEQLSMQQFTRLAFGEDAEGDPEGINAVEFAADAEADDFADLIGE